MSNINWVDLSIVGGVALSMLIGLYRGFVKETISLASWILGGYLAFIYSSQVGDLFSTISSPFIKKIIGAILIFVSVSILSKILNMILSKFIHQTGLTSIDRFGGVGLGMARAGVLIYLLIMLAGPSVIKNEPLLQQSVLIPKLYWMADQISKVIPPHMLEKIKKAF